MNLRPRSHAIEALDRELALAQAAIRDFDTANPEVKTAIAARKADRTAQFLAYD